MRCLIVALGTASSFLSFTVLFIQSFSYKWHCKRSILIHILDLPVYLPLILFNSVSIKLIVYHLVYYLLLKLKTPYMTKANMDSKTVFFNSNIIFHMDWYKQLSKTNTQASLKKQSHILLLVLYERNEDDMWMTTAARKQLSKSLMLHTHTDQRRIYTFVSFRAIREINATKWWDVVTMYPSAPSIYCWMMIQNIIMLLGINGSSERFPPLKISLLVRLWTVGIQDQTNRPRWPWEFVSRRLKLHPEAVGL